MAAGVDFREMRSLQQRLEKLKTAQLAHDMADEAAARLLRMVKSRTPAQAGDLRSKWKASEVSRQGGAYTVSVYNSEDSAADAEFGCRTPDGRGWVPGSFMMTASAKQLERDLPGLLQERMDAFLKEAAR